MLGHNWIGRKYMGRDYIAHGTRDRDVARQDRLGRAIDPYGP